MQEKSAISSLDRRRVGGACASRACAGEAPDFAEYGWPPQSKESCRKPSRDEQMGVEIVRKACGEPLRQIAGNAGWEGAIVAEKVRASSDPNYGLNAQTEQFEDLVSSGVIDPTKVTRTALQNAVSIAALMLTTEALVCEIPEKKEKPMPSPHGGDMDY
jgi:chaperonin GroEL